ncbi:MAG TPA: hypothetical protein VFG69_09890, partial [Nannocystaceae bacterium]|nr:hypothetical protein [Nannocystaceae bacterium]
MDAAVLHGCGQASDPSVPCRALQLDDAAPATVTAAEDAPVIAVSSQEPFVVVRVCPIDEECVFHQERLVDPDGNPGVARDSAVLVTGEGRFVVAIDSENGGGLYAWPIDVDAHTPEDAVGERLSLGIDGSGSAAVLVASLRDSDMVLVRDRENRLKVFDPAGMKSPRVLASGHPNLKVVAIGEKYIVGREDIDGEHERLLLVPADLYDDLEDDADDDMSRRPVDELLEGRNFSRVEISANDELVVATSGDADDGETFVFDVESGALLDRFIGAAVNGFEDLEAIPGLRATAPDGSHLAYRTSSGALALRDLQSQSACLVRSSSAGDHRVAGFGADGMIYMQAELAFTESRVFAFDTRNRSLVALDTEPGTGHHLAAVPHLLEQSKPYAIGVRHGEYAGMQPDREPTALGMDDAVWLARDDLAGGIWAAETVRPTGGSRKLALRRFVPELHGRAYVFDRADDTGAHPPVLAGDRPVETLATISGERTCLSTGTP